MKEPDKSPKGYNEKNPIQPQGSVDPDKNGDKCTFPATASPNEKLSIPERKLLGQKR